MEEEEQTEQVDGREVRRDAIGREQGISHFRGGDSGKYELQQEQVAVPMNVYLLYIYLIQVGFALFQSLSIPFNTFQSL